jgi:nucleotide-binding universal stress UspA family protein
MMNTMSFRKILCAIDFSDCSRVAMRRAVLMARESRAALTLVHVWQVPWRALAAEVALPTEFVKGLRADAERTLMQWSEEARGGGADRLSTLLVEGAPWDWIVETLRNDPAYDLVVLGTHGRTGLRHVLVGSVAEKVVRHAPCDALVVRPRD